MKTTEKLTVLFLKTLGYLSMFGISSYLLFENFYDGSVSSKVELGMSFLIGVGILFIIAWRMIARSVKNKEIAYEVTRAMGKATQGLNPVFLEIWNMLRFIIPLAMLGWLEFMIGFYESSIYIVILYFAGAIGIGYIFRIFAVSFEQGFLTAAEEREEDALVAKIKA